jgi:hypothetical protein
VQMVQLAARTRALEQENANLQFMLGLRDSEISRLRGELASLARGAGSLDSAVTVATSPTEPAALTGAAPSQFPPSGGLPAPPPGSVRDLGTSEPGSGTVYCSGDEQGLVSAGGEHKGVGLGSIPGLAGEKGGSWEGSTDKSRSLPMPRSAGGDQLIAGQPLNLAAPGMSSNLPPGIVIGLDGQWLRVRPGSVASNQAQARRGQRRDGRSHAGRSGLAEGSGPPAGRPDA